jgi:hypothetical protein
MWDTAEVRWFFRGPIPEEVSAWFAAERPRPEPQPPRVDHYLIVRDTDGLGIKLREGRLEIKQRYGQGATMAFAGNASGTVELWRKWGFSLTSYGLDGESFETLDTWVAVQKARQLRNYAVRGGALEAVPAFTTPGRSCSVELTEVLARDHTWWTLGFEAVGNGRHLKETLHAVARSFLAQERSPTLRTADAYGYPRWLQLLVA